MFGEGIPTLLSEYLRSHCVGVVNDCRLRRTALPIVSRFCDEFRRLSSGVSECAFGLDAEFVDQHFYAVAVSR